MQSHSRNLCCCCAQYRRKSHQDPRRIVRSREYLDRAARNILSLEYFNKILRDAISPVKVIILKGEAILNAVNESEGRRRLAEIDILIKREDLPFLKSHLSKAGYRFPENITPSSVVGYINSVMGVSGLKFYPAIHLHWHTVNNSFPSYMFASRIDIAEIWREAEPIQGWPDNILVMAPHHQLIYLSEHGLKHSFEKPKDLHDIYNLIVNRGDALNWNRAISVAKGFNLTRAVYYGLYFTSEILGAEIPQGVLDGLKPNKFTSLERRFIRSVFKNKQNTDSSYAVYLAMNEGLPAKARFIVRTFFPPREAMGDMQNIAASKIGLTHYLGRIARGIQTMGRILP